MIYRGDRGEAPRADFEVTKSADTSKRLVSIMKIVDEPFESILETENIKIDQQSDLSSTQFQVREQLRLVDWRDLIDCLELHDNKILDQQIQTVSDIKADAIVLNWLFDFGIGLETTFAQFMRQTGFISRIAASRISPVTSLITMTFPQIPKPKFGVSSQAISFNDLRASLRPRR